MSADFPVEYRVERTYKPFGPARLNELGSEGWRLSAITYEVDESTYEGTTIIKKKVYIHYFWRPAKKEEK